MFSVQIVSILWHTPHNIHCHFAQEERAKQKKNAEMAESSAATSTAATSLAPARAAPPGFLGSDDYTACLQAALETISTDPLFAKVADKLPLQITAKEKENSGCQSPFNADECKIASRREKLYRCASIFSGRISLRHRHPGCP